MIQFDGSHIFPSVGWNHQPEIPFQKHGTTGKNWWESKGAKSPPNLTFPPKK